VSNVETENKEKVASFKSTISPDLYSAKDFIDFSALDAVMRRNEAELEALNATLKTNMFDADSLAHLLVVHPRLYAFFCSLLSISGAIAFEDGRVLPAPSLPPGPETARSVATLLLELGLASLLDDRSDVWGAFRITSIAADASRRRFRIDARIRKRVGAALEAAIDEFNKSHLVRLELSSAAGLPRDARLAEYVVAVNGVPRIAVATTFQTYSGGRQTREFSTIYPNVQRALAASGLGFILIADGQGVRNLPERVLRELFDAVPNTVNLRQAEAGELVSAFERVILASEEPSVDQSGLQALVASALEQGDLATADYLPVPKDRARLALAAYASVNSQLDLELSRDGETLRWRRGNLISSLRETQRAFNPEDALRSWAELVSGELSGVGEDEAGCFGTIEMSGDAFFREPVAVFTTDKRVNRELLRDVARVALHTKRSGNIAILITPHHPSDSMLKDLRDAQSFLPVTVVVQSIGTSIAIAQKREPPRERLRSDVLEQSDLTKLSPFVVRGVTPSRVFFGREVEEATLLSTLSTNSVAILGGRRIGKTSLMRHSFERLSGAGLRPFFGDCQTVRTWADFAEMAHGNWGVSLPQDFRPSHLDQLIGALNDGSGRSIVVMLDEIDQLLDWDRKHSENEVPEAFFRACRSISQRGLAQFVFSGERTIANRLWDATSPHWNFCRPLLLSQLTYAAAASLISEPLEALGVQLLDAQGLAEASWQSTNGHPELIQFVGDGIVQRVNSRDRVSVFASPDDVESVTNQFLYAEQYLETYWGQASALERYVSLSLVEGVRTFDQLFHDARTAGFQADAAELTTSLRMLELYGIARQAGAGYELGAQWFRTALGFYGGTEAVRSQYAHMVNA